MRIIKSNDGRLCACLSPVSYSNYEGGCWSCGSGKDSIWGKLPDHLDYPEFIATGFFCYKCKEDFVASPQLRKAFATVLLCCFDERRKKSEERDEERKANSG